MPNVEQCDTGAYSNQRSDIWREQGNLAGSRHRLWIKRQLSIVPSESTPTFTIVRQQMGLLIMNWYCFLIWPAFFIIQSMYKMSPWHLLSGIRKSRNFLSFGFLPHAFVYWLTVRQAMTVRWSAAGMELSEAYSGRSSVSEGMDQLVGPIPSQPTLPTIIIRGKIHDEKVPRFVPMAGDVSSLNGTGTVRKNRSKNLKRPIISKY